MDRKSELESLHSALKLALVKAKPSEVASLAKEMRVVVGELLAIKPETTGEKTALEFARESHAARLSGSAAVVPSRRRSQSRRSGSNHRAS